VIPQQAISEYENRFGALVRVIAGGDTRRESVNLGLEAVDGADFILVHDAARALTPPEVFRRVNNALTQGAKAVVPVVAVSDTLKRVGANGCVEETLDRSGVYSAQTPQGFQAAVLREAHSRVPNEINITDDASMVEWCGIDVLTVAGEGEALKITEPRDVEFATAILEKRK